MALRYEGQQSPTRRYNVGVYIRLSVDDSTNSQKKGKGNPFQAESTSIENQRDILTQYVQLRGWNLTKVYADDGYAGGSFNRPAFLEMVQDAELGLIDLILVKDLSRLGRDYIEVGRYTDDVFPTLGVRFIALMDGIDSEGSADILPFRSLLNDYHLKDLSRKIKSVLEAKAKAGAYVGAFAPYGYKKHPQDKGRLVVDPYSAEVVRKIFNLRLQRLGYAKIAKTLNDEGILSSRAYYYHSAGKENPYNVISLWRDMAVKKILKDEVYLGHSIKFKKRTQSYKNKKLIDRPEDEWIRVENTHEPIISQEVWDEVQSVDLKRYTTTTTNPAKLSLFAGLIFCDNGHAMACNTGTKHRKDGIYKYRSYFCAPYKQTGGSICSWHSISENVLLSIIRADVSAHLENINFDEDRVVQEIQSRIVTSSVADIKKQLHRLSVKLERMDTESAKLYEDRLDGAISLDTFKRLSEKLEAERLELQAEHDVLAVAQEQADNQVLDIGRWISGIRHFMTMETPDRETLHMLIEKIIVSEREGNAKGKGRRQAVKIIYRFVGDLSD